MNGLKTDAKTFDSNFTFLRGRSKSQNDWCVTNSVDLINSFSIVQKLSVSDHSPLSMNIKTKMSLCLDFIKDVSDGTFSYRHYDRSNVIKPKLTIENINSNDLMNKFDGVAEFISQCLQVGDDDLDNVSILINDKLYDACRRDTRKRVNRTHIPPDKVNLTSHNFRAIAEANLNMYILSIQRNDNDTTHLSYFECWKNNVNYAIIKEKQEFNIRRNRSWQHTSKNDPKKMWEMINYKDEKNSKDNGVVEEKVIQSYFRGIFQADRLIQNPVVADVKLSLDTYHMYVPILDDNLTLDELITAIRNNGRGFGLDSIEKKVALLFNGNLQMSLLNLFNHVFNSKYPYAWTRQLLRPEKKKGHSVKDPKLRGIAITQLLPTLYDIMLYNRFNLWYHPNAEQAGFRPKQGCLIQIFAIYVIMELLKSIGKCLYIGFLDYEKAFDFINRANLVQHLRKYGAGAKFVKAVASMYEETNYVPKLCNRMGEAIVAKHGVTQGRQSSTSFFSFEVSDLKKSISAPKSILNDSNLLQLADDTALLAEEKSFLCTLFRQCFQFSADNYMYANVTKTYFLHLSDNAD